MFILFLSSLLVCTLLAGSFTALAEEVYTAEMVERSLTAVGNTERLHRAIEKAQKGEEVSIVYLGGSITEGASAKPQQTKCYAYQSAQLFAEKFMSDPAKLKYRNSGISGTPSLLGVTRCEQDVLAYAPDVVFVEFAVNDGSDTESRWAYESLVRKLLNSETQPAVILLFTVLEGGYNGQGHMQAIGEHYDLGMISVKDAIWPEIQKGTMKWSDYSADYAHPVTSGHGFIAELIGHYFDVAAQTAAEPYAVPEAFKYGIPLANLANLRDGDAAILSTGSFSYGAATCYSYTTGWRHLAASGGSEPMVIRLNSGYMTVAFKQEPKTTMAQVEIWVDGELNTTIDGYASNAWGNIVTKLVKLGGKADHTIEFRIKEGDENKNFYLLDIGYAP